MENQNNRVSPVVGKGPPGTSFMTLLKIFAASSIGIFMFFVSFSWTDIGITALGTKNTIFVDHMSGLLISEFRFFAVALVFILMVYGGLSPFFNGQFQIKPTFIMRIQIKKSFGSVGNAIFGSFKFIGLLLAIGYLIEINIISFLPGFMMEPTQMLPFLFEKLALSVGLLIPLGSIALTFLIGFGFLEIVGVLMERVMRPLFRTPGYSSVDAVTSFVGSYSVGLLITNRMYVTGKYSVRDAVITATGFSTVSATFMVIVANVLSMMEHWNLYFWSTFVVTFLVTAITAYLPPIAGMDASYKNVEAPNTTDSRLTQAINAGALQFNNRPPLLAMLYYNIKDGLAMSAVVAPSILAVGFLGMCIAKFTPLFDLLGYTLKPALMLAGSIAGLDNASASSGAHASGLAEMFLPAIFLANADFAMKFIASISSVSTVLFFSGCIPCILATQIPIKIKDLLIIWFIRASLSIIFSSLIFWLAIQADWFPDYKKQASAYQQACEINDANACLQLGILYAKGYVKPLLQQTKESSALLVFEKACGLSLAQACTEGTKIKEKQTRLLPKK